METLNQTIKRLNKTVAILEAKVKSLEEKKSPVIDLDQIKAEIIESVPKPKKQKINIAQQIKEIVTEKFVSNLYRNKNG